MATQLSAQLMNLNRKAKYAAICIQIHNVILQKRAPARVRSVPKMRWSLMVQRVVALPVIVTLLKNATALVSFARQTYLNHRKRSVETRRGIATYRTTAQETDHSVPLTSGRVQTRYAAQARVSATKLNIVTGEWIAPLM
jgi:hypothetical protein